MQNQKNCSQRSDSGFLFSSGQSQILSFSSPSSHSFVLPHSHHRFSSPHSYNTGSVSGGLNGADMNAILSGVKGPFTPSQWMELEHQALIYKYINENNPVPSDLLNPIRKALQSAQLSTYSGLNTWPGNLEWGTSHLGFPRNTDPELGRCRRTDGKKWRCSKDAVADRKYCERHTKKGRKSSRKPVEGQTGHNISGATTNTTTKFMPMSSTSATLVVPSSGTFYNSGLSENNLNSLQHKTLNPSTSPHLSRSVYSEGYAYEKVQGMEFGLVSSDSLQNPFQKASSMNKSKSYESSAGIDDVEYKSEYSLRQFMGDWPKCQSDSLAIPWPEIDTPSDRTRLSLSMPIVAADFMSSTSSPTSEKLACSPQRISREIGFGRNTIIEDMNQRRATWDSICWETSIGGPLGEVLHSSTNSASDSKNTISP